LQAEAGGPGVEQRRVQFDELRPPPGGGFSPGRTPQTVEQAFGGGGHFSRRPGRGGPGGTPLPPRDRTAALGRDGVPPDAPEPGDSFPSADLPEATGALEPQAGLVLGKRRPLQRPDALPLRLGDDRRQELPADAPAALPRGDVDADL